MSLYISQCLLTSLNISQYLSISLIISQYLPISLHIFRPPWLTWPGSCGRWRSSLSSSPSPPRRDTTGDSSRAEIFFHLKYQLFFFSEIFSVWTFLYWRSLRETYGVYSEYYLFSGTQREEEGRTFITWGDQNYSIQRQFSYNIERLIPHFHFRHSPTDKDKSAGWVWSWRISL